MLFHCSSMVEEHIFVAIVDIDYHNVEHVVVVVIRKSSS